MTVKGFDSNNYVMGMMTSYNWIGTVPVISDANLLKTVLREEWGFVGTVISDYNGSYGYQISDLFRTRPVLNGDDRIGNAAQRLFTRAISLLSRSPGASLPSAG